MRRVFFLLVFFAAFFVVAFFRVVFFAVVFFLVAFFRVVDCRAVTFGPPLCSIRGLWAHGAEWPAPGRELCNTYG